MVARAYLSMVGWLLSVDYTQLEKKPLEVHPIRVGRKHSGA